MRRKYKLTGCARLFLVIIVLAPLAYLGASYINGEDGIENFKNLIGIGSEEAGEDQQQTYTDTSADLRQQLQDARDRIDALEKENRNLRDRIESLQKQVDQLKEAPAQE